MLFRFLYAPQREKLPECFYEIEKKMCFLVCAKQKQIHATWASTIRSVSAQATPLHLLLACFSCLVCSLWFCPLSFHQSFLLLDTALGPASCCLALFLFSPLSLWKTLCPPVLKFRGEGEMSWHTLWVCCCYTWMCPRLCLQGDLLLHSWTNEVVFCLFCTKQ